MQETVEITKITPELATEMLESNFKNNRTVNKNRVSAYASDMTKGQWNFTGEGIKFDIDDTLIDGQHRLAAIIKADMTVEMLVVRGLSPETMITMDTQMGRTLANVLKIMSYDRANELSRTLLTVAFYERYMEDKLSAAKGGSAPGVESRNRHDRRPYKRLTNGSTTRQDALEILERRQSIIDSVAIMTPLCGPRKTQIVRPQVATVSLIHDVAQHGYGGASAIEYVEGVRSGIGDSDQPAWNLNQLLVRNALERGLNKLPDHTIAVLWMRGYEQYVGEAPVTQMRRSVGNLYPTIPGDVDWYLNE